MRRLEGRKAVVVGVGSAVGRACAEALAAEGADVIVVDRAAELADEAARAIGSAGGVAVPHRADPADEADARGVAAACEERWGRLDAFVDCAAAMDFWAEGEDTIADWETVIRINLLGPVAYTKALLTLLRRSDAGAIVFLGSVDGILGNPTVPAYSVSKAGLIPLTHVLAHDCAPIRVNCVAGAAISQVGPNDPQRPNLEALFTQANPVLEATPLGRYARPEDIASVVAFLVSEEAAYVTGAVVPVDGGRTAITPGTGRRVER
jgi:NAD(P)-dependent dehydrogenase (short-subunit alcohol dehydrogenase family)